jgi:hypothetical protein
VGGPSGRCMPRKMDSWWLTWTVGGFFGLGIVHEKFFGDAPADLLYGKKIMALYVKWLFPYKLPLA